MKYTEDVNAVMYAYLCFFQEWHTWDDRLLLKWDIVTNIMHVDDKKSIVVVNSKWESRRLSYDTLLSDKDTNYSELFNKHWKELYGEPDAGFNKHIDNLVNELNL